MTILHDLIDTLNKAKEIETSELDMRQWKTCGTNHCICGWHAFFNDNMEGEDDFNNAADEVSYALTVEIGVELSISIYAGNAEVRKTHAIRTGKFTEEELTHPHLTTNSSFDDAIDWINIVKDKV